MSQNGNGAGSGFQKKTRDAEEWVRGGDDLTGVRGMRFAEASITIQVSEEGLRDKESD